MGTIDEPGLDGAGLDPRTIDQTETATEAAAVVEGAVLTELNRRVRKRRIHSRPREREALALLATGLSDKEVARFLRISPRTVQMHIQNFCRRNCVRNRVAAVALWTAANVSLQLID